MPVEPVNVKKGKGKGRKGKGKHGQDEVKVLPEGEVLQRDVKQYTPQVPQYGVETQRELGMGIFPRSGESVAPGS